MDPNNLVFIGLQAKVIALRRDSGEVVWEWKDPSGWGGYMNLYLDGDRLICAVNGYVSCLDFEGRELWRNPLKGMGVGVTSIATVRGSASTADGAAITDQ